MTLRGIAKAVLVFVCLFIVASSLLLGGSSSALQGDGPVAPLTADLGKGPLPSENQGLPEKWPDLIPLSLRVKIDPRLLKEFYSSAAGAESLAQSDLQVRYIVHLASKADLTAEGRVLDLKQRREAIVAALRRTAQDTQVGLVAYLEGQHASGTVAAFTPYWIFNGIAVQSDLGTLLNLAARSDVEAIRPDRVHYLPPVVQGQELSALQSAVEWNIAKIGADRVWNAYGLRGEGMVVANMDTGVDWTHPALQRKYRGYDPTNPQESRHDYNWFDATGTSAALPHDGDGHGTHTMGTMVGSLPDGQNAVGVAPAAQWIAVKIFDDQGETYDSWIHAAFQWILAPTDLDGRNPDPNLAPDVCSNSWGDADGTDTTFEDDLHAWRMAGIFPAFAVGNEHDGSLTVSSPGSLPDAFAVGATDWRDAIAPWSCRGPSPWSEIKPEVVAPGVDVRSTLPDNRYGSNSGTSMSTPHVAGVVALLWQAQRQFGVAAQGAMQLTITTTEQIITGTAFQPTQAVSIPNNTYGWGRVDADQAIGSIARAGTFWGRVTDATSGMGISDATITMINQSVEGRVQIRTDPQGYYTFSVAAGTYDVLATSFYHSPQLATGVEIIYRTITQLDFRLTPLPAGRIVGRVQDQDTGQAVTATLWIREHGISVHTDDHGDYAVTLPLGSYTLEAVPRLTGHRISRAPVTVDVAGQTVTQDFALQKSPRILLVDADVWASASEIGYYQQSLESSLYAYDMWSVSSIAPDVLNIPPTTTLQSYDLVIWSQPLSSPGYIGAWGPLSGYLDSGKALFISGQDIGYWDESRGFASTEYQRYLHVWYVQDDSGSSDITGLSETSWAGITLTLNVPDSADNQFDPSEIAPADAMATAIMSYVNDGCAAVAADDCRGNGYRSVYLAFGLEGAGPEVMRTETLERAIEWLMAARPGHDVSLVVPLRQSTAAPGQEVTFDLEILNTGALEDVYQLAVEGSRWPVAIWDTVQGRPITVTSALSPCVSVSLGLRVRVPEEAVTGQTNVLTIHVSSTSDVGVSDIGAVHVAAAMPWQVLPPLPSSRYRLGAAAIDDCRFVAVGGWDADNVASAATDLYDLNAGAWRALAPKPTAAANIAAAAIEGKVYVPGGMRGDNRLSILEIYDPQANRWTRGADLPRPISGVAVAAAQGKLYVFGGSISDGLVSTTLEYDPAKDVWAERAPLPGGPRAYAAAATLGGKIYVAGGWPALGTFECYDPVSDSWVSLSSLPLGRHSLGLVSVDGYIYAVGGGSTWTGLSRVERYDPTTDSWLILSALSSSTRAGVAAAALAGRILAVGGTGGTTSGSVHESLAVGASLSDSSATVDRRAAGSGESLSFAVTLRNPGVQSIPQVSFYAEIPTHTAYISDSASGGATYNPAFNRVEWQGEMPPQSGRSFRYQVVIAQGLARGTVITNTARIDDGWCGEQAASVSAVVEAPDLSSSTKRVDKAVAESGDTLTYRIELNNVGAITATDVHLVDALPAQVAYVPDSVIGAVYDPALNQIEWSGQVLPGAGQSYLVQDSDGGGQSFAWIDATAGTAVSGGGDDVALGPFDIGFPFTLYGATYTQFYINTNGQVLFGSGSRSLGNVAIPNSSLPNNFVAPFWDDLVSDPGTLYYTLLGSAPQRRLVIEWANVRRYGSSASSLTFEVVLYEGSQEILLQYGTLSGPDTDGKSATVGIEDETGTRGVQYECDGQGEGYPLHPGLAILLQPVLAHSIVFQARVLPDLPINTSIQNQALLTLEGQPQVPLTATTRVRAVDLSLCSKAVDQAMARSGDTISYQIELSNIGLVPATNVTLVDALPAQATYISGSVVGAVYNSALNRIEWTGELAPGMPGSYGWDDSDLGGVTFNWVDATVGGYSVGGGDDASFGPFEIGFPFEFYGAQHTQFYISTNGQVTFDSGSSAYSNDPIPTPLAPNNFIAAFWDDLVASPATIWYKLADEAPQRKLVIEWASLRRLGTDNELTFELVLYEGSNDILLQYQTLRGSDADGSSATVGIEDGAGMMGIQYAYNGTGPGHPLHDGLAVLFRVHQSRSIAFQARVAPDLPVNTLIMNEAQLTVDGQTQAPLVATTWVHRIDLSASTLTVDKPQANAGDRLVYEMLLTNSGNITAPQVSLVDPIPSGTVYVPGSASAGVEYNELQNRIEWYGAVFPQESRPISFTVATSVAARHNTPVTNTATLDDGAGSVVTRTAVAVLQSYDLASSDKVMPAAAHPGDVITCTVRVRNTGQVATSATMTDVIPNGMILLPASVWCSSGECEDKAGSVIWQGQVIGQGVVMVRFQVQLAADVQPGAILSNTVQIREPSGLVLERLASTLVQPVAGPYLTYLPLITCGLAEAGR